MKVNLAVQVLSATVSNVLSTYSGPDCSATDKFCSMMNSFFDCLNVRCTTKGKMKRNNFLLPYTSPDDERFNWLENVFLKYLNDWQGSIQNRSGNFSAKAKAKMFISKQTFEGLTITVYPIINIIKFLLHEGMELMLTEKLCQDVIEEHFGRQRELGSRNDNPTIKQFGYNDNTLRMVCCSCYW